MNLDLDLPYELLIKLIFSSNCIPPSERPFWVNFRFAWAPGVRLSRLIGLVNKENINMIFILSVHLQHGLFPFVRENVGLLSGCCGFTATYTCVIIIHLFTFRLHVVYSEINGIYTGSCCVAVLPWLTLWKPSFDNVAAAHEHKAGVFADPVGEHPAGSDGRTLRVYHVFAQTEWTLIQTLLCVSAGQENNTACCFIPTLVYLFISISVPLLSWVFLFGEFLNSCDEWIIFRKKRVTNWWRANLLVLKLCNWASGRLLWWFYALTLWQLL